MSALLSLNAIPLISWKEKTFNQIHSSMKKNGQIQYDSGSNLQRLFRAPPLKIYRREIANAPLDPCNSRASLQIDGFNRPGGTITNSKSTTPNGLVNTIDMLLPNNTCDNYSNCSVILSPADNARNRVRSSGMIKRKFNENKNNDTYYTSSSQYLSSRNRTFAQNQYNYLRMGNSAAKPGTSLASANVYSTGGTNHCQKYYIAQDTKFQYKWINKFDTDTTTIIEDTLHEVIIPIGYYTIEDINRKFKQVMFSNLHFFIKNPTGITNEYYSENISYALNIAYNNNTEKVELQTYRIDEVTFPVANYTIPTVLVGDNSISLWSRPVSGSGLFPQFDILDNIFKQAVGFNTNLYPLTNATSAAIYQVFTSTMSPGITPLYVKLHYKPSNPQFAQQGAVSSGDLITRKKYNSITNSTSAYRTAFGNSVANALAYGVPENGYTVKDKLGYPMKKTPTFPKYSDEMKKCSVTSFANAI
jgi:hypothetical protein